MEGLGEIADEVAEIHAALSAEKDHEALAVEGVVSLDELHREAVLDDLLVGDAHDFLLAGLQVFFDGDVLGGRLAQEGLKRRGVLGANSGAELDDVADVTALLGGGDDAVADLRGHTGHREVIDLAGAAEGDAHGSA